MSAHTMNVLLVIRDDMQLAVDGARHGGQKTNGGNGPLGSATQLPSLVAAFRRYIEAIGVAVEMDQQEANARLIAAAPELLEALKGEASVIDGKLCWCGMPNMVPYRGHDSGCEYNRELIAKVEGES